MATTTIRLLCKQLKIVIKLLHCYLNRFNYSFAHVSFVNIYNAILYFQYSISHVDRWTFFWFGFIFIFFSNYFVANGHDWAEILMKQRYIVSHLSSSSLSSTTRYYSAFAVPLRPYRILSLFMRMKSSCSDEFHLESLVPLHGSTSPQFPISFLVNSINLPEMLDDLITHRFFIYNALQH